MDDELERIAKRFGFHLGGSPRSDFEELIGRLMMVERLEELSNQERSVERIVEELQLNRFHAGMLAEKVGDLRFAAKMYDGCSADYKRAARFIQEDGLISSIMTEYNPITIIDNPDQGIKYLEERASRMKARARNLRYSCAFDKVYGKDHPNKKKILGKKSAQVNINQGRSQGVYYISEENNSIAWFKPPKNYRKTVNFLYDDSSDNLEILFSSERPIERETVIDGSVSRTLGGVYAMSEERIRRALEEHMNKSRYQVIRSGEGEIAAGIVIRGFKCKDSPRVSTNLSFDLTQVYDPEIISGLKKITH